MALVRERTIPTERPPPVGEVSANFCGQRGVTWSAQRIPTAVNLCFLDRKFPSMHNINNHNTSNSSLSCRLRLDKVYVCMSHGYSRIFPSILDHESSTPRSRKPNTAPPAEPEESSPQHSHPIRHTSIFICIVLPVNLFLTRFAFCLKRTWKKKGDAIPLQAWARLRLPDFKTIGT